MKFRSRDERRDGSRKRFERGNYAFARQNRRTNVAGRAIRQRTIAEGPGEEQRRQRGVQRGRSGSERPIPVADSDGAQERERQISHRPRVRRLPQADQALPGRQAEPQTRPDQAENH